MCFNGRAECTENYKKSVINAYINRAFTHCFTWEEVDLELRRFKIMIVNNGYSHSDIESCIKRRFDWYMKRNTMKEDNDITLYYKAYFNESYKMEEKKLKEIIGRNMISNLKT